MIVVMISLLLLMLKLRLLLFYQCFDAVGWMTGRDQKGLWPVKISYLQSQ